MAPDITPPLSARDDVVREMVGRIVRALDPEKIVLFGSRAADRATPSSDVDLLVVMPAGTDRYDAAGEAYAVVRDFIIPIDIVVRTQDELDAWGSVSLSFAATIAREGRIVYERASAA